MIREKLMKSNHQKLKKFSESKSEWCKRIQSLVLVETYACGTKKDLTRKKEEIKGKSMITQYKKWLTLMILQKKTQKSINLIGQKFLIIRSEYL